MTTITPPSPALSECDSLADIEDLDAFLSAQGPLSLFPTPGLKSARTPNHQFYRNEEFTRSPPSSSYFVDSGGLFTPASTPETGREHDEIFVRRFIRSLLVSSGLPEEVAAIAFNILRKLATVDDTIDMSTELDIIAAMALAEIYISDHPHRTSFWARMTSCSTTATQVDAAIMEMFERLNWSIHLLCHPTSVEEGMSLLQDYSGCPSPIPQLHVDKTRPTLWINGQVTPASSSPTTAVERRGSTYFLPLL